MQRCVFLQYGSAGRGRESGYPSFVGYCGVEVASLSGALRGNRCPSRAAQEYSALGVAKTDEVASGPPSKGKVAQPPRGHRPLIGWFHWFLSSATLCA